MAEVTLGHGQEWLTLAGQAARLTQEAQRGQYVEEARYYSALVALAANEHFTIFLTRAFQNLFLVTMAKTPEDFGEQRFLLHLLRDLRQAQGKGAEAAAQAAQL